MLLLKFVLFCFSVSINQVLPVDKKVALVALGVQDVCIIVLWNNQHPRVLHTCIIMLYYILGYYMYYNVILYTGVLHVL